MYRGHLKINDVTMTYYLLAVFALVDWVGCDVDALGSVGVSRGAVVWHFGLKLNNGYLEITFKA